MVSYAPLFAHVDGWQWTPDLIWFNNLSSYWTTNYYVQKLFSNNKGTKVLNMLQENKPLTGQQGLYASATLDEASGEIILKLVNTTPDQKSNSITLQTKGKIFPKARMIVLKSDNLKEFNTIEKPENIMPVEQEFVIKGKNIDLTIAPYSLTVLRISTK